MSRVVALLIALFGCRQDDSIHGRLVDARTGRPVTSTQVSLSPTGGACRALSVPTDADGGFVAAGLCIDEMYRVEVAEPYVTSAPTEVTPGAAPLHLEVWALPSADGVWLQRSGALVPLGAETVIDTLPVFGDVSAGVVRIPVEVPSRFPRLDGADAIVLTGEAAPLLGFAPLSPGGPRALGAPDDPVMIGPWWYLGAPVIPDATHIHDVSVRGRGARYLTAASLPPGAYALTHPSRGRAVLFEVARSRAAVAGVD